MVWLHGQKDDSAFCETPESQAWLLELADEGPISDSDTFGEDIPPSPGMGESSHEVSRVKTRR